MASRMVDVSVVVWPADRYLEEIVGGNVFCEDMTVLNATHMVALLEARLQKNRGVPIAIGKVEYYDDAIQKWMVLVAEHDLEKFAQPIKLRVWGRSRHYSCRVLPLRASSQNFAPRSAAFYAADYAEFESELRSRLPQWEQDFRDILYNDPVAGWVLLEDISAIPSSLKCVDLKLIPTDKSMGNRSSVYGAPASRWLGEGADFDSLDGMSKLEALINMENARQREEDEHARREEERKKAQLEVPRDRRVVPHNQLKYGDKVVDMPVRIPTAPLAHTSAEIRYLHNDRMRVDPNNPYYIQKQNTEKYADPNRDECCYPGSGLVHSMDTSNHGDLKRQVIGYIRAILQDPYSPLAEYLPRGGLPTNDLVNLTALAAHYFMVRCPVRPGTMMDQEDRAHVHSILAHCISEMPFAERRQREREADARQREALGNDAAIGEPSDQQFIPPVPDPNGGQPAPQVVLMRPLLTEDLTVIVYGTVTCKLPVVCKWRLRSNLQELSMEDIFDGGLAVTEPVSASSFCIKLLPGAVLRGQTYHLTLVATSDPDRKSDSATQQFNLPA